MKFKGIITDTFRECLGKKILTIYFIISTLGILGLIFIFNVDIAGNQAAIATLFGKSEAGIAISKLRNIIIAIESGFAVVLYSIGIFISVFATADIIPSMMSKGRLNLYLARPISRHMLLLGKFSGAVLVTAINII